MSNYPQILTSTCVDIGTLVPTTLHSLIQKKKKNRSHNLNLLINKSHSLVQQQQKKSCSLEIYHASLIQEKKITLLMLAKYF